MLTQVDVAYEEVLPIKILGVSPKDSLLIRQITGLNPPDIDLFIGDYSRDGGIYQGRRVQNRNVVITIDLNPNPALGETVDMLREKLYKAFADPQVDGDFIQLNFHDETGHIRYLYGYVEKFETEVFAVETMVQVSIICPDPYIRDFEATILEHPIGWTTVPVTYKGTAETGFDVVIYINSATPILTLDNNGRTMVIDRNFEVGDIVKICTERGDRWMTITHGTDPEKSIIGNLRPESKWIELHSQANVTRVYGAHPGELIASIRELHYTSTYWGI